jgi:hypothetical protein
MARQNNELSTKIEIEKLEEELRKTTFRYLFIKNISIIVNELIEISKEMTPTNQKKFLEGLNTSLHQVVGATVEEIPLATKVEKLIVPKGIMLTNTIPIFNKLSDFLKGFHQEYYKKQTYDLYSLRAKASLTLFTDIAIGCALTAASLMSVLYGSLGITLLLTSYTSFAPLVGIVAGLALCAGLFYLSKLIVENVNSMLKEDFGLDETDDLFKMIWSEERTLTQMFNGFITEVGKFGKKSQEDIQDKLIQDRPSSFNL